MLHKIGYQFPCFCYIFVFAFQHIVEMEKVKYVDEDKKYEEKEALKKSKKFKKKKYEDKNEEASILKFSRQTAPIDDKSERKTKDVSSSLQSKHSKKKKHKRSKELKEAGDQTIEGKRRKQKRKVKVNENEGNIEGYQGSNKEFDANEKKKENQNEKGGTEIIKKKKHKKMKKTARNISSDVSDEMKSKEVDTKKSKVLQGLLFFITNNELSNACIMMKSIKWFFNYHFCSC